MALTKVKKEEIIKQFGKNGQDSGSTAVQVALLTEDIKELTDHMRKHHKDVSTKRGLLKKVSRRKALLKYLQRTDITTYQNTIKTLELKK